MPSDFPLEILVKTKKIEMYVKKNKLSESPQELFLDEIKKIDKTGDEKVLSDSQQEILDETKEIEEHKTKNVLSESLQEMLIG